MSTLYNWQISFRIRCKAQNFALSNYPKAVQHIMLFTGQLINENYSKQTLDILVFLV